LHSLNEAFREGLMQQDSKHHICMLGFSFTDEALKTGSWLFIIIFKFQSANNPDRTHQIFDVQSY